MSGGHIPSEPGGGWRFPTAQEVNLLQHENMTLREMVERLNIDLVEGRRLLAAVRVGSSHHLYPEVSAWLKPDEPRGKSVAELMADDPQCSALMRGLFTNMQSIANNDSELQARIARKRGKS